jgi:voltage-gated sodium channel
LLTFINCIAVIATQNKVLLIIDEVLIWIFIADMILKIVGLGPEQFFYDKWNHLDFALVVIILIVEVIPDQYMPFNSVVLLKMLRSFRVTTVIKLVRVKMREILSGNKKNS